MDDVKDKTGKKFTDELETMSHKVAQPQEAKPEHPLPDGVTVADRARPAP